MTISANRHIGRIESVRLLSSDVRLFCIEFDNGGPRFEPGGHVDFELPLAEGHALRSYSMVGTDGPGTLMVAVRLSPESRGGSAYMWRLSADDRIVVYAKRNNLPVTFAGDRYVMLAGGIGITPLVGIAQALLAAGKEVRFVYCVRDATDAPFVDKLAGMLGGQFELHDDRVDGLYDVSRLVDHIAPDAYLYMCGPVPMMDVVNRRWRHGNRSSDHLRFETFGTSGGLPAAAFDVKVVETGDVIHVTPRQTLLEALLGAGQPVMYDCRKGECGLCKVRVVEFDGKLDHRDVFLGDDEKAAGTEMCCCVSRVFGRAATIQIDSILHGRSTHSMTDKARS